MKRRSSLILFGVVVMALVVMAAPLSAFAFHSGQESDLAASPELAAFRSFAAGSAGGPSIRGASADAMRWVALGQFHAEKALLAKGSADSARWVVLGAYYTSLGSADSARWVALGRYYAEKALVASGDADSARWEALGRSYTDGKMAANPELISVGRFSSCGC